MELPKKTISKDLYKVRASEQTKKVMSNCHQSSSWQPEDVLKAIAEARLQRTSL